jgi:hypothetical protein
VITIFTIPKPFDARNRRPQDNALATWRAALPEAQIIVFGDEEGIEEAAKRHGVEHAAVLRNEHGTPLLDAAFAEARRRASHPLLAYVNSDILFGDDLRATLPAIAALSWTRFVVVGRRTDLDLGEAIDTQRADWQSELRRRAREAGRLHEPTGIDYMIFPTRWPLPLPRFPVGRVLWDNWVIHHARSTSAPVIDATSSVSAIHQNHGYAHIGGARAASAAAEVAHNWAIVGPDFLPLTISDATHRLVRGTVRARRGVRYVLRRVVVAPALTPGLRRSVRLGRAVYRFLRRFGA